MSTDDEGLTNSQEVLEQLDAAYDARSRDLEALRQLEAEYEAKTYELIRLMEAIRNLESELNGDDS